MFVLSAPIHRNGAACREYYQPEEKGLIPGVVFGPDGAKRAKQYATEEEARADIPNWIDIYVKGLRDADWGGDLVWAADRLRESIAVVRND